MELQHLTPIKICIGCFLTTPNASPRRSFEVPVEAKVAFLRRPDSYPEPTTRVEAVETHLSWVFLTDGYAYKLKKPIRYEFLDFRTLDARHRNCDEELRLNRRFAPDVYLHTMALVVGSDGAMRLGGSGRAIDWLVVMRRLPRDRMLDHAIKTGTVDDAAVIGVASMLVQVYAAAAPVEILPSEYRKRFADDIRANLIELRNPLYGLAGSVVSRLAGCQLAFLRYQAPLLDARVEADRIIEAHGDLRPEHICLGPRPVVIDCLEFRRDLRILDPIDDLAFLAMECGRLGAPEIGRLFLETYARLTADRPPERLIRFHMSHRAALRAKIAAWHIRDAPPEDRSKWLDTARTYIRIAERCIDEAGNEMPRA